MKRSPNSYLKDRSMSMMNIGLLRKSVLFNFFIQIEPLFTPIHRGSIVTDFDTLYK